MGDLLLALLLLTGLLLAALLLLATLTRLRLATLLLLTTLLLTRFLIWILIHSLFLSNVASIASPLRSLVFHGKTQFRGQCIRSKVQIEAMCRELVPEC
jgi:hypothetical protein